MAKFDVIQEPGLRDISSRHTRPRRTQAERSATTQRQLLEAAAACLAELGYAGSTLEKIASRANMSRGALQHQFRTREELLTALVDELGVRLITPYESVRTQQLCLGQTVDLVIEEDWENLRSPLFVAVMQVWLAMRGVDDWFAHVSDRVGKFEKHLDSHWVELFADTGLPPERITALRHLVFSTLRGLAVRTLSRKGFVSSVEEIALLKELVKRTLSTR